MGPTDSTGVVEEAGMPEEAGQEGYMNLRSVSRRLHRRLANGEGGFLQYSLIDIPRSLAALVRVPGCLMAP